MNRARGPGTGEVKHAKAPFGQAVKTPLQGSIFFISECHVKWELHGRSALTAEETQLIRLYWVLHIKPSAVIAMQGKINAMAFQTPFT